MGIGLHFCRLRAVAHSVESGVDTDTGYGEVAELRANVAALEAKGGKVQLSTCGPKGRLCARVSANDAAVIWGPPDKENEKWIILNGY